MAASIRGTAVTAAIAVVVSLGLLLPGTPTVAAGAEQERLSAAPEQGPAGSHAQVDGTGFAHDRVVEIRWEPTGERLGTAKGPKFSITVSIPDDAAEGSHAIEARGKPAGTQASDARHATAPFTVTASGDPDDDTAPEDGAEADGDTAPEDGAEAESDDDAGEDGEDSSAESDGSEAGDDEREPSEEPQSTDGDADDGSGDADFSSGTPGEDDSQRTGMSPDPDEDVPEKSDGQDSDGDERDTDRSDSADEPAAGDKTEQSGTDQRDAERDPHQDETGDPAGAPTGRAETATAAPRENEGSDDASSSEGDRSSATTFRKSSEGPPAAVSHEVGTVQPSATEQPPDVDFAAAPDSAAFQDALPPEVAADGRVGAQPEAAVRERLATAGGSRHTPTETTPSTPQGTPAAVGTQAAAPNSEEISLLVLLAASSVLLVWHRRRQPLLRRR